MAFGADRPRSRRTHLARRVVRRRRWRWRDVDTANLRAIVGVSAAVVTAIQAVTAVVAIRRGRRDYADAWLASASSAPAGLTLPAPMLMSYLLMFATGAKRTERRIEDRPGYRDYQRRVSFFFPWRPHA